MKAKLEKNYISEYYNHYHYEYHKIYYLQIK
jgi:hypothetical protein